FSAGLKMLRQMKKTVFSLTVISAVVLCMLLCSLFAVKFSTIFYILICGAAGLVIYLWGRMKHKKEGTK
ncbi:MAG: chromate transporter, partial [Clostridia bacterium]|nr:chromate transporter [Clostridia bacterium]